MANNNLPKPAHDLEAEAAVLSAVMLVPTAFDKVASNIQAGDFYSERHRRIFEACAALHRAGKPVDVVHVGTWLRDHDRLEQVGGMEYVTEVVNAAPAVANVESYADTVARKARVRRVQVEASRILAEAYAPIADEEEWIERSAQALHKVSVTRRRAPVETMRTVLHRVIDRIEHASDGRMSGLSTGFHVLDEVTGGLQAGELTIVAARPGMGKTAFGMSLVRGVAKTGRGVVVFSLEMPNDQIVTRTVCGEAGIEARKIRAGNFTTSDYSTLIAAAERVDREHPHVELEDQPCSMLDIRSRVRTYQAEISREQVTLGLVVVDFAQLMTGRAGLQREQQVSENVRDLKLLAKELACPIVLLSQLNRDPEKRTDKRPMLCDLRESGALEEQGDNIIGLYREAYYNSRAVKANVCELLVLKNRHGPTGTVEVGFDGPTTRFFNLQDPQLPLAQVPAGRLHNGAAVRDWHEERGRIET